MPSFLRILAGLPDLFIPRVCLMCAEIRPYGEGQEICESCLESLERSHPPWCPTCGRPFNSEAALTHSPHHLCAECTENPPAYDMARALGPFDGSLRELIYLLKYQGYTSVAFGLGSELGKICRREFSETTEQSDALITFVPIERARWKERGFDQARILAQCTADFLNMNSSPTLERKVFSRPQTQLPASSRRKNLRGIFTAPYPNRVSGKRVILVDDVLTTGSTASACAQEIKKAGAASVEVLTICHTVIQNKFRS